MRIVFAGTPQVAVPSLRALVDAGHEVIAVVTRPDARQGRGKKMHASPVAIAAEELGLQVVKPAHPRDNDFVDQLRELAPDACAVVAYGALIPQHVLDIPEHGWVNLHFSLLPAWRGAAPVQRAVMAGDQTSGVTTFRLVHELDAGPIYRSLRVPLGPDETSGEILDRLAQIGSGVLVETMDDIAAGIQPVDQDTKGISVAAKVTVEDAYLDWTSGSNQLLRIIRGTSPEPGAWTLYEGKRFKVLKARVADSATQVPELGAGEITADKRHLWVGTGDGALELVQVQAFGKKPMSGADWARGAKPEPGARFDQENQQ